MLLQTLPLPDYIADNPQNVVGIFEQAATGFYAIANTEVLAAGRTLAGGLAVIGVVQRGATYALNGRVDASGLMKFLLTAALILGLLEFWGTPFPGLAMTPPEVISGMGRWLVSQLLGSLGDDIMSRLHALWQTFWLEETGIIGQIWAVVTGGAAAALGAMAAYLAGGALLVLGIGAVAAGMAQVIWAGVAIAICVMLGPILVPWLLFQPLSFLFWGWLKTLLTYTLYAPISVAVLHIFVNATLNQIELVLTSDGWAQGSLQTLTSILTGLLLAGTSILAVIKVPALANGLISGGGAAGSGVAEAATQHAASSTTATMAGGAQTAARTLASSGIGAAQPSITGGAPIGTASRFAAGVAGVAAQGLAGAAQAVQGAPIAGQALPRTKRGSP